MNQRAAIIMSYVYICCWKSYLLCLKFYSTRIVIYESGFASCGVYAINSKKCCLFNECIPILFFWIFVCDAGFNFFLYNGNILYVLWSVVIKTILFLFEEFVYIKINYLAISNLN